MTTRGAEMELRARTVPAALTSVGGTVGAERRLSVLPSRTHITHNHAYSMQRVVRLVKHWSLYERSADSTAVL